MKLRIPVSAGEIIDKATILEIKAGKLTDPSKIILVIRELKGISAVEKKILSKNKKLKKLKLELYKVNRRLWDIENSIRKLEAKKEYEAKFIKFARSVYINNDKRSRIKNQINILAGSAVTEIKQYTKY